MATSLRAAAPPLLVAAVVLVACSRRSSEPSIRPEASGSSARASASVVASAAPSQSASVVASAAPADSEDPPLPGFDKQYWPLGYSPPMARETKTVVIDGVTETWTLRWRARPEAFGFLMPDCRNMAFTYGEHGLLDLERARPGAPLETLHLDAVLDAKTPAPISVVTWPQRAGDGLAKGETVKGALEIVARPVIELMSLRDYDHDGLAAEFPLTIDEEHCNPLTVLVGVDRRTNKLRALSGRKDPSHAVVLPNHSDWETLAAAKGDVAISTIECGNHFSGAWEDLLFHATATGMEVTARTFACAPGDGGAVRGKLISSVEM
jgi:hypothetical protein